MIRRNVLNDAKAAADFIAGVTLLKDPARFGWPNQPGLSVYDAFVFWHHQAMMLMTPPGQSDRNAAHSGPAFLPWHRYFLLRLEMLIQHALGDTNFRLPYWDWSADAELADPTTSALWDASSMGRFETSAWGVRLTMDAVTGELDRVDRSLHRNRGAAGALPRRQQMRAILREQAVYDQAPFSSSSVAGVRNFMEGWIGQTRMHNNVHVWVGGDMALSSSPNDPVFFLHHCNCDRIWAAWQGLHSGAAYVPDAEADAALQFHRLDDALYSIFNESVSPRMMLNYAHFYQYDYMADLWDTM